MDGVQRHTVCFNCFLGTTHLTRLSVTSSPVPCPPVCVLVRILEQTVMRVCVVFRWCTCLNGRDGTFVRQLCVY